LDRRLVRVARAVGNIEDTVIIKPHMNWPLHKRWASDTFQIIAFGNREDVRWKGDFLYTTFMSRKENAASNAEQERPHEPAN
jgi:hypothetical protein